MFFLHDKRVNLIKKIYKKITNNFFIKNLIFKIGSLTISTLSIFFIKNFNKRLVILREDRIGHQAANFDVEIFKAEKRLLEEGIKTCFIFSTPSHLVSNLYLRNCIIDIIKSKEYSYIILNDSKYTDKLLIYILSFHQQLLKNNKYFYFSPTDRGQRIKQQLLNTSNNFNLLLESLGISKRGYICIYARDEKYLKNRFPNIDWSYHDFRNSDINNFKLLSEYLINRKKNNVVRIGSNTNDTLKWINKGEYKIIDYANSKHQNPKNDIDIISGCKLYIGSGGGLETVAIASRKEIIRINVVPINDDLIFSFGLWMPKLHIKDNVLRYLSLEEICQLDLHFSTSTIDYEKNNVTLIENTDQEILDCYKDYIKYRTNSLTDEDKEILKRFQDKRNFLANKYGILKNSSNFIAPSFLLKYCRLLD